MELPTRPLRALVMGLNLMIAISSLIVTGINSFFLRKYSFRSAHVIFQEVIAVITLAIYMLAIFLPLVKRYKGYMLPLNAVMSYLWLTSFIFSAQDWTGGRCSSSGPTLGKCGLKRTVVAFAFLCFFFLFCSIFAEGLLWRTLTRQGRDETRGHVNGESHKEHRASNTTTGTTNGVTHPADAGSPNDANNV